MPHLLPYFDKTEEALNDSQQISDICEIIDNSVEADSTSIEIIVKYLPKKLNQKWRRIEKFVFIYGGN